MVDVFGLTIETPEHPLLIIIYSPVDRLGLRGLSKGACIFYLQYVQEVYPVDIRYFLQ